MESILNPIAPVTEPWVPEDSTPNPITLSAPVTPSSQPTNSIDVPKEMAALARMTIHELRAKYRELYGFPSMVAHKTYLRKRILWKLQSIAENLELSKEDWVLVNVLSRNAPVRMRPKRKVEQGDGMPETTTNGSPVISETRNQRDPRIPPPGTILRRFCNGQTHEVTVLSDGFDYQGEIFKSLSTLAKRISTTKWNGFGFFSEALAKARAGEVK